MKYHTLITKRKMMDYPKGKYAWSVKVGEKGQFVIPKEARDVFNINAGDSILVLGDIEQGLAIPRKESIAIICEKLFHGEMPNE